MDMDYCQVYAVRDHKIANAKIATPLQSAPHQTLGSTIKGDDQGIILQV